MTDLLGPALYPAVRAVIEVTLDAKTLPDEIIGLSVYSGRANRWLALAVPGLDGLTGDDLAAAKRAVTFYCAGLLATKIPALTSQKVGDTVGSAAYTRQAMDGAALAADLFAAAADELSDAGLIDTFIPAGKQFDVVTSTRGQYVLDGVTTSGFLP